MARTDALQRQCQYVTAYLAGPESFEDWRQRMGTDEAFPAEGRAILEAAAAVLSGMVEDHAVRRGEDPRDVWSRWMLKVATEGDWGETS
jgi:hypothetical protein